MGWNATEEITAEGLRSLEEGFQSVLRSTIHWLVGR